MAKKFFLVCGAILMLVLTYALGANSEVVVKSAGKSVVGIAVYGNDALVVTADGDVYQATNNNTDNWTFRANVFEQAKSE